MGMDLKPLNPSPDAPRWPQDDKIASGQVKWGRYNWLGWSELEKLLAANGMDTSFMVRTNDGVEISEHTCKKVAQVIEKALPTLDEETRQWLESHIALWRTCGGYAQL